MTKRYERFSNVNEHGLLHQQLNKLADNLNNNQDELGVKIDGNTSAIVDLQGTTETQTAQIAQIMQTLGTLGVELAPVIAKATKKKKK